MHRAAQQYTDPALLCRRCTVKPDLTPTAPASNSSTRFSALLRLAGRLSGFDLCGIATPHTSQEWLQLDPPLPDHLQQTLQPLLALTYVSPAPLLISDLGTGEDRSAGLLGSFAGYPLSSDTGDCLGVFYVADRLPRAFESDLQETLQDIADSAALLLAQMRTPTPSLEENRMALAIQGSGTGIWDRDLLKDEIHYSVAWKAMLGYAEDEVSTRIEDSYARVHPDDREQVLQAIRAHLDGHTEQYQVEHRLRCRDGNYKWVSSRGKVVARDAQGKALRMLGITNDISNLRTLAERLQHSVELVTQLTDQVPGAVFQYRSGVQAKGGFTYVSAGVRDILEVTPEALMQDPGILNHLIHPDDLAVFRDSRINAERDACTWHVEFRVLLPRQGLRWRLGEARPQREADGSLTWHGVVTDITERKRFERELHEFASMDALTQLTNRRVFMDHLDTEQARILRRDVSVSSLLMCDLDHFKLVNDRWGHGVGDRALRHFSEILRSQLRTSDLAGRIGGEEFAVLLSGAGNLPARDFACRVQHALANQPLRVEAEEIHLTLSIGLTQLSPQDTTPDNALSRADKALYRAKQNGRNRVEIN